MLGLSRKTMLALEAVVDIAYNARPGPVQSKDITARQGVPHRYLEQALQHLVRHGVLKGVRGPRGGYRLARERRRISVGQVVRLLADLDQPDLPEEGAEIGRMVLQPMLQEITDQAMRELDAISIEDLCQRARREGIAHRGGRGADFEI